MSKNEFSQHWFHDLKRKHVIRSNIPASQDPAAPITAVRNTHNDSTILHDDLPDVSTSSGGDEDFLTAHRVVAGNSTMFRKQKDAMSFGGLQFLADSRSTMQNLANEADV